MPKSQLSKYNTDEKTEITENLFDQKSRKSFSRISQNMIESPTSPTYDKHLGRPFSRRLKQNMTEFPTFKNS